MKEQSPILLNTGPAIILAVDLPPTTLNFKIREDLLICDVSYPDIAVAKAAHWHIGKEISLPPGKWELLGWSDEISEDTERKYLLKQIQ